MEMKWNGSLVSSGDSFRIEAEINNGFVVVKPIGLINEDVNFGTVIEFIDGLQSKPVRLVFDMGAITRINSCGVREWLLFLQRVQTRFVCSFSRANEAFIEVAVSVPTVFGKHGTLVEEVEAPYFCSNCNKRALFNLKAAGLFKGGALSAPPQVCTQCRGPLEFDGLAEEYFNFLKHVA